MKCSRVSSVQVDISSLQAASSRNAWVTGGKAIQASHAFSLPLLAQKETMSHPVMAWKTGSALHLSGPSFEAMSWIAIFLKCFPVPNDIHNFLAPSCCQRKAAGTTTSVTEVLMMITECPCLTQSAPCTSRRVSAYSCVQGAKFPREISSEEQTTFSWHVLTICSPDILHGSHGWKTLSWWSCMRCKVWEKKRTVTL